MLKDPEEMNALDVGVGLTKPAKVQLAPLSFDTSMVRGLAPPEPYVATSMDNCNPE